MLYDIVEKIADQATPLAEEFQNASLSYPFKHVTERLVNTIPEDKRSGAQHLTKFVADTTIDVTIRSAVAGVIPPVESFVVCSSAAVIKSLVLSDGSVKKFEDQKPINLKENVKEVAAATASNYFLRTGIQKAHSMAGIVLNHSSTGMVTPAMLAGMFAGPITHNLRIPSTPQTKPAELSLLQKTGHLLANAGIDSSVGLGLLGLVTLNPTLLAVAILGVNIGTIANTIVGKERNHRDTTEEQDYKPSRLGIGR